jgi:acetyltransferase-like isoleucine patch superfamily enzyme
MAYFIERMVQIKRYPTFAKLLWWRTYVPMRMRALGLQLGDGVEFFGQPVVSMKEGSSLVIGAQCSLCSVSQFTALGVNHPIILRTLRSGARIEIGVHTGLSGTTICAAQQVTIGNYVLIGANVTIADTDFHPTNPEGRRYRGDFDQFHSAPVRVEDNVFIGAGAYVLKGVTIGKNSVIGAGSVVTRDVPPNSIAAGNPARVIGDVRPASDLRAGTMSQA